MTGSFYQNIVFKYFQWHFFDAPKEILKAWRNFLLWGLNYFALPELLKTFFSPWRRYSWSYGRGFDLQRYAEVFLSNLISRLIGAVMRSFLIILGLISETFIILAGAVVFLLWLILPVLLIIGLWLGFKLLI